ncbi:MAG: sialate O-acetylesterase, partial [Xanthomonadales bacterium]|nr:sialate O-acetylesterase [Xanthomonadales bacterium]
CEMMQRPGRYLAILATGLLFISSPLVFADVSLPRILGDGLVLQRDIPNKIWGWAETGEAVTVKLDGEEVGSVVAIDGEWMVLIETMPAGGPHQIVVTGRNQITLSNVYFGDLWIASGQSNMQLPMERVKEIYGDEIAAANYPLIRMFTVPRKYEFKQAQKDLDEGGWQATTPETVLDFSAVAYFFAKELSKNQDVPIGIISSNYGGSPAEAWMSEEALESYPHYLEVARSYRDDAYLNSLLEADQARSDAWYANIDTNDSGLNGETKWYDPAFDASSWEIIDLPADLEDGGLAPMNGVVWLRKEFMLPASAAGIPAKLMLGRIVDADFTYVNGELVGNTTYQYPPRRYLINEGTLREGKNTITVRLISNLGKGGFVKDKPYWIQAGDTKIDLSGPWRYHVGVTSEPLEPPVFRQYMQPLGFYNAMLAPLLNLSIKGVIWYQGESNTGRPGEYAELFPAMIRDWRTQFGQGDFPFLFVQLTNFMEAKEQPEESLWAETRDAQLQALSEPNTAMVVTIDVGEWNDIHPLDKKTVGQRLALAARKIAYGESDLVYSGPTFKSMTIAGNKMVLEFDNLGTGLVTRGNSLNGFAIAGADGKFVWAEAKIEDNRVVVWSNDIQAPVKVRYAWADNPDTANLYNRQGLPASPFQAVQ